MKPIMISKIKNILLTILFFALIFGLGTDILLHAPKNTKVLTSPKTGYFYPSSIETFISLKDPEAKVTTLEKARKDGYKISPEHQKQMCFFIEKSLIRFTLLEPLGILNEKERWTSDGEWLKRCP